MQVSLTSAAQSASANADGGTDNDRVPKHIAGLAAERAWLHVPGNDAAVSADVLATPDPWQGDFYRFQGKRILDIATVLLTLPLTIPVIALAAIVLWIESGFPFYRQERLGHSGTVFSMFKLRTMTRDAEGDLDSILAGDPNLRAEWDATQKLKNDPRITPVGAFLRRTSIDELPQIWNVLKGEMSLVGPRPMMLDQLELYGNPRAYFALHPGISGFWQVCERNESQFAYRAEADRAYLLRKCFWVDLQVIWRTIFVVLRRTGY